MKRINLTSFSMAMLFFSTFNATILLAENAETPDCQIQTAPINCSGHESVTLTFEHIFRWMNYAMAPDAGLFVGESTDGVNL